MRRNLNPILKSFVFVLFMAGFKPSDEQPKLSVQQYIEKYNAIAVDEMLRSRIPASITLAQGILESGNGNSRLATEANNHFGIKCKNTWTGETIYEDDDAPQECFRKYSSAIDSYRDHSDFLMKNVRYAFLFDLEPDDYKGWANGLKKAGYATNPQYAELLITFIEKHKLHEFDKVKLSDEEKSEIAAEKSESKKLHGDFFRINGVKAITALKDESFAQISLQFDLEVNELYRFNDLQKDARCNIGDTIFIEPKKNKGDTEFYTVSLNETMYNISQRTAIKLDKLLDRNLLIPGQEPAAGQLIFLRNKRDSMPKLANAAVYQVVVEPTKPNQTIKIDTQYNNKVYEQAAINLETQKPAENIHQTNQIHEIKENMS